jgi:hypothetical protein
MKTTMKMSALSMMLLFAVVTAYSSAIGIEKKNPAVNLIIRHVVNVVMPNEQPICGAYLIEVRNESGQLVAPAKRFVPGQSAYVFYERADQKEGVGTRTALLRKSSNIKPYECAVTLSAQPFTIKGSFETGKSYRYNLILKLTGDKD